MGRIACVPLYIVLAYNAVTYAEILDDSQSPRQQFNLQFRWDFDERVFDLSADELNQMVGELNNVEVRLDTSAYVGRSAQIFLRLPDQINGLRDSSGFTLQWVTRGVFASGQTQPGNQALIFDGQVTEDVMIEFFDYTMRVDARKMSGPLRIEPVYEIEAR